MAGKGGKRANAGRKSRAEELGLVALLDKCFDKDDREACIKKLAEDCQSNDFHTRHESRKLLLAYTFGKPTEKHEHSGSDGQPLTLKVVYESKPHYSETAATSSEAGDLC